MTIRHLSSHECITNPIGRKVPIRIDPMQSVPVKCRILNFSNTISANGLVLSDCDNFADDLDYFQAVNQIQNLLGDKNNNTKMDDLFDIPICETTGNYCIPVERNQLFLGSHSISGGSEIEIPGKNGEYFNTNFIQGLFSTHWRKIPIRNLTKLTQIRLLGHLDLTVQIEILVELVHSNFIPRLVVENIKKPAFFKMMILSILFLFKIILL